MNLKILSVVLATCSASAFAELRVPAFTAYFDPDPNGARITGPSKLVEWTKPTVKVRWFGEMKTPGEIQGSVVLRLPKAATVPLRLSIAGQSHEATATGTGEMQRVDFGG